MGGVSQYCLGYASYSSVPGQVRQLCPCQILPSMATSQEESAAMVVLNTRFIICWCSYPCTCTGLAIMTCLIIPLLVISQIGR